MPEGPHFAQCLTNGLNAELLFRPALAPGLDEPGPLAPLSQARQYLAQTLTGAIARPNAKKMPALVPGGWALVVRGAVAVSVGSLVLTARDLPLASLAALVAAYALADGTCTLFGALRTTRAVERWWPLLLQGLVSAGLGAQALLWPSFDGATLLYYVALWSAVAGALELGASARLREEIKGEWRLALRGLTALGLGALLAFGGRSGAAGLVFWLGPFGILFGALHVALGLRLRTWEALPSYDARRPILNRARAAAAREARAGALPPGRAPASTPETRLLGPNAFAGGGAPAAQRRRSARRVRAQGRASAAPPYEAIRGLMRFFRFRVVRAGDREKSWGSTNFFFDNSGGRALEQVHYGKAFESLHAGPGAHPALRALVCLGRGLGEAPGLCRGGPRKRSEFPPFSRVPAWCGRYEFRRFPLVVLSTQTKPPRVNPRRLRSFLPPKFLAPIGAPRAPQWAIASAGRARPIGVVRARVSAFFAHAPTRRDGTRVSAFSAHAPTRRDGTRVSA